MGELDRPESFESGVRNRLLSTGSNGLCCERAGVSEYILGIRTSDSFERP